MLKAIKSILIFVFSIIIVSLTSYLYLYKGFIQLPEGNKVIIHKEKIINKDIKEKTYTIQDILNEIIEENKYNNISKILLKFLNNPETINFNLNFKIKDNAINQINNLFNKNLLQEGTKNEIYINIENTKSDTIKYVDIYGLINDQKFIIKGYYFIEDKSIVLNYLKIDGFLSLMNYKGIKDFLNDGFNIKYSSIIGKKISLQDFFIQIDKNIPEIKKDEIKGIIIGIENFVKLEDTDEFYFLFSDKLKNTTKRIKNYILTNKELSLGQKQNLMISVINLVKKLDNTNITLNKDEIVIKNNDSPYLFDFNIKLTKNDTKKDLNDLELNSTNNFSINDIYKTILEHNKILVKYLNGEDFLFLINDKNNKKEIDQN